MRSEDYLAILTSPANKAETRERTALEREIRRVEEFIGEPLDLDGDQWARLGTALPVMQPHDWTAIRLHGRGGVEGIVGQGAPSKKTSTVAE